MWRRKYEMKGGEEIEICEIMYELPSEIEITVELTENEIGGKGMIIEYETFGTVKHIETLQGEYQVKWYEIGETICELCKCPIVNEKQMKKSSVDFVEYFHASCCRFGKCCSCYNHSMWNRVYYIESINAFICHRCNCGCTQRRRPSFK